MSNSWSLPLRSRVKRGKIVLRRGDLLFLWLKLERRQLEYRSGEEQTMRWKWSISSILALLGDSTVLAVEVAMLFAFVDAVKEEERFSI
jgi:hypothetical protein